MTDPNYRVEGMPPAILGKITALVNATRDAAFVGAADPCDRPAIEEYEAICRYNLETTIMTHLQRARKEIEHAAR